MNKGKIIIVALFSIFLSACWPEDESIAPIPAKVLDYTFYTHQIYYNLAQDSIVGVNLLSDWDLGFESNGNHIILNTGKGLAVADLGAIDFTSVNTLPDNSDWVFDASSGNTDSLAINQWVDTTIIPYQYANHVYVLGLNNGVGYNPVKKCIFTQVDDESYSFTMANMDNSSTEHVRVLKNKKVNFTKVSVLPVFALKEIEPARCDWDLLFTQYATILFDDDGTPVPYLVRGVLINPVKVEVAKKTVTDSYDFYLLDSTQAALLNYSNKKDIIGYDWKDVVIDENANSARYTTNPNKVYIIRARDLTLYKLRFLSFYNQLGEPGYIGFESVKMNN